MTQFKGTPGPWRVVAYDAGDRDEWPGTPSVQASEELDCGVVHWAGFSQLYWQSARGRNEMEANARLIAAAPELLEALIEARSQLEEYENAATGEKYNSRQINAAIAKALGGDA